ncbi:DUF5916 domain-containing protein [Thalassotalea profundi]|uniref:Carbohydrate binding family 9 domain-containing protein n=1 Tax=Thalassotalea profundi TaxID=2036687 RepID=A0ABQ3IVE4_9GAMM|nr:DUF5916 domain-containing protein [Thalassotalea profundi]GHE92530.1 hypothetical protein GCM10011501_22580 [Thalassotalea profundi]
MKALIYLFVLLMLLVSFISKGADRDITVDGLLDEEFWQKTTNLVETYQVSPQTFRKSDNNFSYKFITSEKGIYIALTAIKKNKLRLRTQENDKIFTNDHFQVMLDMDNSGQTSYVFSINHQGNYFDGIYKQDKELDLDWSAQWQYAVNVSDDFWTAEIFIPWSSMSFSIQKQNQFGLAISRLDEASNSTYASIPANSTMNSFLQLFSKHNVVVKSHSGFDIYPHISLNRDIINNDESADIGAEIFWKPTKNQQISVTLNPDFGQVETDELVVNFSAIESFFTEKRPFFNENQSIFDVSGPETLRIVHTPRIGGDAYYDDDYSSDLDAALKYTYANDNFALGLMSAFESSLDNNSTGRDFWLMRGQYYLGENKLGISLNNVSTPSVERQAQILSTDFIYTFSDSTEFNIGIINSRVEQQTLPINDIGWWITGSSEFSINHSHEFSLFSYGEHLQLNDIGYVKRVNRKQFEYEYQYQIPNLSLWSIRDIAFSVESEIKTNFQDEKLPLIYGVGIEFVTEDEFEYQFSIEHGSSGYDDFLTRGYNSLWLPSFYITELEVSSPEYLWGKFDFQFELGTEGFSGRFYNIQSSIEQQFNDNLYVSFTMSQYNSDSWLEWDEGNIIDEFDFTEQGFEVSANYQITDNHEIRIKLESVIGKAKHLANYQVDSNGKAIQTDESGDFSFAENAFQLRYKYSFSKLTAFYLSYGFGGEFEDDIAKFGKRNLYKKAIESKEAHNIFAKLRLHF